MSKHMSANEKAYIAALRYQWLTPMYDRVVKYSTREHTTKHALLDMVKIEAGEHVLDVGCGTGTLALMAKTAQPYALVFGIDADKHILDIAQQKVRRQRFHVQFSQSWADKLNFAPNTFDCVVSSLFFHHLQWQEKLAVATEIMRVLKPGGRFGIADWGEPSSLVMRYLFKPVQWLDGYSNTQENLDGKLKLMLEITGFQSIETVKHFNTIFGTLSLHLAYKPFNS